METSEQQLRDLAEKGSALLEAYCVVRDAVPGTEDKRAKQAAYDALHVVFGNECRAIIQREFRVTSFPDALEAAKAPDTLFGDWDGAASNRPQHWNR